MDQVDARRAWRSLGAFLASTGLLLAAGPEAQAFRVRRKGDVLTSLKGTGPDTTFECLAPDAALGSLDLAYRFPGGAWRRTRGGTADLEARSGFEPAGPELRWTCTLRNRSDRPLEVGDLALALPMRSSFQHPGSAGVSLLKHAFVSGAGSFLFWGRPAHPGPFLTLLPGSGTSLEYWDAHGTYRIFVHARASLEGLGRRDWRQPATSVTLAPSGAQGDTQVYRFAFRWAEDYAALRRLLADTGKLDMEVAPGMTLPSDLPATLALRSREPIEGLDAEFPEDTLLEDLGPGPDGAHLFRIRFRRLGENRLTVRQRGGRRTYLEFFSAEPVETLVRKRARFIAAHQHRDPTRWYDGLLAEWNQRDRVLLGPDTYDQIHGWRIYEVTCDDPGLSKPAFLASKLAEYPDQGEVDALDRYVGRFLWGGLQRTRQEPWPFAIYGIPDWKTNRESPDPGTKGRLHLWRPYDYPHVVVLYLGLYRTARLHPWIHTALPPLEYLRRAHGTAVAMFTTPLALEGWSALDTGFYNEAVLPGLIEALQAEGLGAESAELRGHWERKVARFLDGKVDLFGSEYPFDSTGFESTHALGMYALRAARSLPPADRLRSETRARTFLDRQLAANVFCRGWVEPAYYLLGSDYRAGAGNAFTLSYMSPMGGGSILDYALRVAADPGPLLRLGYASILSSWALMNSGTAQSGFGAWFPGEANDGATGGGFEPSPASVTWLGQAVGRGPWYYSCETDLGYCGFLRSAATILADDAVLGRTCFGGLWRTKDGLLEVDPRDGVRRRFHALLGRSRLHAELDRDRFAPSGIQIAEDLSMLRLTLETEDPAPHATILSLEGPAGAYRIEGPGLAPRSIQLRDGEATQVDLPVDRSRSGPYILARR